MKKHLTMAIGAIAATTALAEMVTVTDTMDNLSGWSANANWSTSAGVAETTQATQFMTMQTGVAAPQAEGDWVSAKIKQRIAVGTNGLSDANQYSTRLAIVGDTSGTSGNNAKAMWTRRDNDAVPGQIWGSAISSPKSAIDATDGTWEFGGWNNISEIGLGSPTNATSDWFSCELKITKAASGYDILLNYYDSTDSVIWTDDSLGQTLPSLADKSIWYLNMGTEYQFTTAADLTKMEVDEATLTSSIPEPATLGLVVAFGSGIMLIRRRFMI
ncbi:hypothetical protein PDESU_06062 [Pontiella desulfatans]|uniref:PEP-CTERM protein-sorting domain-containing protein n=1 Tax=Pontiella desulfatans TaxID=2750659 RepID=A0A6C2UE24_PONDE|nr:hypothetical protein [Pontiella desulfatans]VGO17466.1 hypothetical protein PDESU_06062 [Pontiella desulfatans]